MRTASRVMVSGSAFGILMCTCLLRAAEPSGKELHKVETVVSHAQPSFPLANDQVQLTVTEIGGHMAPVKFFADSKSPVEPYYISPWQDEPKTEMPAPVLNSLRGDFFCMPFGGNADAVNGEKHPPHGEIAGSKWKAINVEDAGTVTTLTLEFETQLPRARSRNNCRW